MTHDQGSVAEPYSIFHITQGAVETLNRPTPADTGH
jgi:hypothetical protein